jgi:hypothetical protein
MGFTKRAKSLLRADSGRGISLWKVWNELFSFG